MEFIHPLVHLIIALFDGIDATIHWRHADQRLAAIGHTVRALGYCAMGVVGLIGLALGGAHFPAAVPVPLLIAIAYVTAAILARKFAAPRAVPLMLAALSVAYLAYTASLLILPALEAAPTPARTINYETTDT
jgi:drug/metabolite transporter (DMT)-like permease